MSEVKHWQLFIDGKWVDSSSKDKTQVINPSTGEIVATVSRGSKIDVDRAVQAAHTALNNPAWRDMRPSERSNMLNAIAMKIAENAQELIYLEALASGGTVRRIGKGDIMQVIDLFMTLAKEINDYPFVEYLPPLPFPELAQSIVVREPLGVCAGITAWNCPLALAAFKLVPALATGNTVVLKPASNTPLSTLKLVEVISQVVPPGVVNAVVGPGSEVGEYLVEHPLVEKIGFTGSTEVGSAIQVKAAKSIKRVTLELGGKSANIIFEDANLDIAIPGSLFGVFLNTGQFCESGTRLFVQDSIYDEVIQRLLELAGKLVIGNQLDPGVTVGPLSSAKQLDTVMSYIDSGLQEGARLVCGGKKLNISGLEGGFFVEPTIFVDVTNDMKIAREEIFGPVLSVIRFREYDEVIRMANDTIYGLAGGVWTKDVNRAMRTSRDLKTGTVWVNDWHMLRSDAPFGGYKQSGLGREMSRHSFDSYTQTKHIYISFETDVRNKQVYRILHPEL